MLQFDINVVKFLNSYVGQSPNFDAGVVYLSSAYLFKMTPMIVLLWAFWFIRDENRLKRRIDVFLAFAGSFVAMATARGLALILRFHARPIHNPDLALQIPYPMERHWLDGWSSMPSDHAALAFALAMGVFLIHRKWGILVLLHAIVVICLPRAYLGMHYLTDLLVGAMVGISAAWLTMRTFNMKALVACMMAFEKARPAIFYVLFFLMASQMLEMFDDVRYFARGLVRPMIKEVIKKVAPEPLHTISVKKISE